MAMIMARVCTESVDVAINNIEKALGDLDEEILAGFDIQDGRVLLQWLCELREHRKMQADANEGLTKFVVLMDVGIGMTMPRWLWVQSDSDLVAFWRDQQNRAQAAMKLGKEAPLEPVSEDGMGINLFKAEFVARADRGGPLFPPGWKGEE